MENVSRHRILRFTSDQGNINARNQRDCTFSTEQFVTQQQNVEFTLPVEDNDQEWYVETTDGNVRPYTVSSSMQSAHIDQFRTDAEVGNDQNFAQPPTITVKKWALNETIESLRFSAVIQYFGTLH